MLNSYNTIAIEKEVTYKEKGSKFIATAFSVDTEDQFQKKIKKIKKKYYDATHHCYAYTIGISSPIERISDDGEPSGTAGKPIAGQIKSKKLNNIAIVISRYFGGTKLGTGGLAQAYKQSAKEVLQQSIIKEVLRMATIDVECNYEKLHELISYIKKLNGNILKQEINTICNLTIQIPKSQIEVFNYNPYIDKK